MWVFGTIKATLNEHISSNKATPTNPSKAIWPLDDCALKDLGLIGAIFLQTTTETNKLYNKSWPSWTTQWGSHLWIKEQTIKQVNLFLHATLLHMIFPICMAFYEYQHLWLWVELLILSVLSFSFRNAASVQIQISESLWGLLLASIAAQCLPSYLFWEMNLYQCLLL